MDKNREVALRIPLNFRRPLGCEGFRVRDAIPPEIGDFTYFLLGCDRLCGSSFGFRTFFRIYTTTRASYWQAGCWANPALAKQIATASPQRKSFSFILKDEWFMPELAASIQVLPLVNRRNRSLSLGLRDLFDLSTS